MSKSPKLKPLPRPLFSCGIFRNCTHSVLSPTAPPSSASLLPPPPPPPPPPSDQRPPPSSSSSSSSSTSPSFTQWRFPLPHPPSSAAESGSAHRAHPPPQSAASDGGNVFGAAEGQFRSGAPLAALRMLEKSLASGPTGNGSGSGSLCPQEVMAGVIAALREPATARPAAKVLLALLLVEPNRRVAVETGAVAAAVEAVVAAGSSGTTTAERALAALELMCTVEEGAWEVRNHALAAPAMGGAVENMQGRGRECAIGVLAAVYGGEHAKEAPEDVVRAVMMAMQGECSVRGRRKGGVLLRALQECGRLDLDLNFDG